MVVKVGEAEVEVEVVAPSLAPLLGVGAVPPDLWWRPQRAPRPYGWARLSATSCPDNVPRLAVVEAPGVSCVSLCPGSVAVVGCGWMLQAPPYCVRCRTPWAVDGWMKEEWRWMGG